MIDWAKTIIGILSALLIAGVIALWKLIGGKVNKSDLAQAIENLDKDVKAVNGRLDQSLVVIAQAVTKTDLIDKMSTVSMRADDKDVRITRDVTELKTDLKVLAEKVTAVDKKLDELPSRVASLEQTRNQNQNRSSP